MVRSVAILVALGFGALLLPGQGVDPAKLPAAADRKVDFRGDIYPILAQNCFACHKGADPKAGYRLDLRAEILGETNGKPLVREGKSSESRLIHLISGQVPGKQMPPKGKGAPLAAEQVGLLRAWIDQGLPWDDKLLPPLTVTDHWAFQPIQRPDVPAVEKKDWVRTPVDAFIAAEHQKRGLSPAPEAPRPVLIRRVTLDLIGLPPTPEEIEAFVGDAAPDAYERLVDRLLASPHYGERWGRHWLDVARWAESEGFENDEFRPTAWRYRDYVVQSFNADKPFDRFLKEQVAGDELEPFSDQNLIATGFLANARYSGNEEDKALQRNDVLIDIVNATASGLLGLTLHCAQCHNHKWDPLSQRDYYRLMGFFVKGQMNNLGLKDPELWKKYEEAIPKALAPAEELRKTLFEQAKKKLVDEGKKKLPPELRAALEVPEEKRDDQQKKLAREAEKMLQIKPEEVEKAIGKDDQELYAQLKKRIEALKKQVPEKPQTIGFYSPASAAAPVDVTLMKANYALPYNPEELKKAKPHLLLRGDVHNRGPEVDVGWPALFGPTPAEKVAAKPRTALAEWLASPSNPLTARVWANRVWHHHFGRGIVATPGDFGLKGSRPTHPHLLDFLASELLSPSPLAGEGGALSPSPLGGEGRVRGKAWSTKHLHRLIVHSATYRQASKNPQSATRNPQSPDPENVYLSRWTPRRLEAESVRDSLLAVSGELKRDLGGPSIPLVDQAKGKSTEPPAERPESLRRSIYLRHMRYHMPPMYSLFDGPTSNESCAKRNTSTVSLQPLFLLNSPYMQERARAFAERVAKIAGDDREKQIETAFRLAVGRRPEDKEREVVRPLLEADGKLVSLCQVLLNLNEFVYID